MNIFFLKKAEKYLTSLPPRIALNILERINNIPKGDIKPLAGRKGEYRLRVGKYRILFFIKDEDIFVVKIDTRGDMYKT
ncbi:MAG: type II toxin-antitoxin system RelE/ParE family toxin [Spirochaetota bacterium]|nr:MAG: type II toxin-antitoxin system RelE/ParE family toxin [Spirochaetota bacterium]